MVLIDKTNGRADCECKGFQFQGVLCSHTLEVMRFVKMQPFLPAHYILKRWTRDANASIKRGTNENNLKGKSDLQSVMRSALTQRVERIIEAVKSRATYDMACTKLDELEEGIAKIGQGFEQAPHTTHNAMVEKNSNESLQFQDPPISQCKGKRKPQRLKSPAEVKKEMRMCSYCHRKEGHNMSTCPKRFKAESSIKVQTRAFGVHDQEDNNERESEDDDISTCPKRILAESSFKGQTQVFGVHDYEDNNECNNERESENYNLY